MIAMPSFTSPFSWRIIAQMSNAYEIKDLDLLDRRYREPDSESEAPWRTTIRYPNVWTPIVEKASTTHLGRVYLGFSRMPAARSAVDAQGVTVVRWTDMRFVGGLPGMDQRASRAVPFTASVRVSADGQILQETLGDR
jgi:hypothetical protein